MKNLILVIGLILLGGTIASSQFSIGAAVGANVSTFDLERFGDLESVDMKVLTSSYTSFLMGFKISDKFNFNTQALISSRGFGYDHRNEFSGNEFITERRVRTINFDISPSLEILPVKWLGLGAGVYGSTKFIEGARSQNMEWSYFNSFKFVKRWDFGLNPYIRTYFKHLFLQFSYQHGLVDINNAFITYFNGNPTGPSAGSNRNFSLGLGILISPKKEEV